AAVRDQGFRVPLAADNLLHQLASRWIKIDELERLGAAEGTLAIVDVHLLLQQLAKAGLLRLGTSSEKPAAVLIPACPEFVLRFPPVDADVKYQLSRFAYLRRGDAGTLILETPRAFGRLE